MRLLAPLLLAASAASAETAPVTFSSGADVLSVAVGTVRAQAVDNKAQPAITLQLDAETARAFGRLTARHIGQPLEVRLCGALAMRAIVSSAIRNGSALIVADITPEQSRDLADRINTGRCEGFVSPFR